jgi:hypothetical protein
MPRKNTKQSLNPELEVIQQQPSQPEPVQDTVQPLQQELSQEIDKDDDSIIIAPKGKRQVSQKTLDALARGREKLKEKWTNDKVKNDELKEIYAIKKVNKVIKQKLKIKENIGVEDLDDEPEQPIKLIQPIKKKKQQVIRLPEISDDEEEIVIKKEPKKKVSKQSQDNAPIDKNNNSNPKILFY